MGMPILSFEKGRDFDTSVAVAAAVRKKNKILTAAGALMANINLFIFCQFSRAVGSLTK